MLNKITSKLSTRKWKQDVFMIGSSTEGQNVSLHCSTALRVCCCSDGSPGHRALVCCQSTGWLFSHCWHSWRNTRWSFLFLWQTTDLLHIIRLVRLSARKREACLVSIRLLPPQKTQWTFLPLSEPVCLNRHKQTQTKSLGRWDFFSFFSISMVSVVLVTSLWVVNLF